MKLQRCMSPVVSFVVITVCVVTAPALAQDCPELVHHLLGSLSAVALEGDYAYLGGSSGFVVADVSNPLALQAVGETVLAPGWVSGIAVSGDYAVVGWYEGTPGSHGEEGGLRVVDARNPTEPIVVGSLGASGRLMDVAMSGDFAYSVEYSCTKSTCTNRLRVIDVSSPSAPVEVGAASTSGTATGLAVSGGYAYVVGRQWSGGDTLAYLRVIDVSSPSAPVLAGQVTWYAGSRWGADHVAVSAGHAYVAGWGFRVIDVTTPSAPVKVGLLDGPGSSGALAVSSSYAYVADDYGNFWVIDVGTPSTPIDVGSLAGIGAFYDVAVSGDEVYAAGDAGLQVIGVTTPSAPVEMGSSGIGAASDAAVSGVFAYVVGWVSPVSYVSNLEVIDVTTPSAPVEVGSVDLIAHAQFVEADVVASAGYAYVAAAVVSGGEPGGIGGIFRVIDVSTPTAPVEVGSLGLGPAYGVDLSGSYVYVATSGAWFSSGTLTVIDVATASSPVVVGMLELPGDASGVAVAGDYAHVTWGDSSSGEGGLWVIDVTVPNAPAAIGSRDTPGVARGVAVAGGYAYVTVTDGDTGVGGMLVIDVSTPSNPVEVGFVETSECFVGTSEFASEVAVSGEYAYVACDAPWWEIGHSALSLRVIDVSAPSAPVEVGLFETVGAGGVTVSDGYVYFAAGDAGMYIFDECTLLFTDGFESGDTSAWSVTVP